MNYPTNAERWKHNIPDGPQPPDVKIWATCFVIVSVAVVLLLSAAVSVSHGADPAKPVLYVFKSPGCIPCKMLENEICDQAGTLYRIANERFADVRFVPPGADAEQAFLAAIPRRSQLLDLDGAGVRTTRPGGRVPAFPTVWVSGRADYWLGFSRGTAVDLARYLNTAADNWRPPAQGTDPQPFTRGILSEPDAEPDRSIDIDAGAITQSTEPERTSKPEPAAESENSKTESAAELPQPETETASTTQPPQTKFDGVRLIVLVAALSDSHQAIRAEVARRANSALQALARERMPGRVEAFLISEVGDPNTFEQIVEVVGVRPGADTATPIAALVLIPERLAGMRGVIVGKVEQVLAAHYLPDLKRAGVLPILERIHGDTFDAVLAALKDAGGGNPSTGPTTAAGLFYLIATYLAERSKVASMIARRFGWVA